MIRNLRYFLGSVDPRWACVEGFLVSESPFGDLTDPLVDHGQTANIISSYHDY